MDPVVHSATSSDGVRLAWTESGSGPTLLQLPGVPFSDFEAEWRIPVLGRAFDRLASRVRLVQFDGRGTGRSDREAEDFSLDAYLADIDAVVAASGSRDVVVLGFYHSVLHAVAWAARHPDRVRGMILFGGALRGWDAMRGQGTQALLSLIERDWDTFVESVAHAWLGWPGGEEGRLAAEWFRRASTPRVARATLEAAAVTDVTPDAGRVACPVLVLHRRDATVIPLQVSEALAAALPEGHLEVVAGSSASLYMEATDVVVDRIAAFVVEPSRRPPVTGLMARDPLAALTPRERDVLRQLASGDTNGEIATALRISEHTVERHVTSLYRKIDARGRADATAWAIRNGLA